MIDYYLPLSYGDCLPPPHLVFPEFYFAPWFGACSFVASFFLTCCFYFSVCSRSFVSRPGKVAFCRRHPVHPSNILPFPGRGMSSRWATTSLGCLIGVAPSPQPSLLGCWYLSGVEAALILVGGARSQGSWM